MLRPARCLLIALALVALPTTVRTAPGQPYRVTVPSGTLLSVSATADVDSGSAKVGDPVAFTAGKPVQVKGVTVIAAGAAGRGVVVYSRSARVAGRGELMVDLNDVQAVDGSWIPVGVRQDVTSGLAGVIPEALMDLTEPEFPHGRNGLLSAKRVLDAWTIGPWEYVVTPGTGAPTVSAAPLAVPAGRPGTPVKVPDGTALRIRPKAEVVSGGVQVGDRVEFECVETVEVGGLPVVQAGARAVGTVLRSQDAEETRQAGELVLSADTVFGVDGRPIPLHSVEGDRGGSNRGLAFAASRLVPLAGLAIRGRQAVMPRDQVSTVATSADRLVLVPPDTQVLPPLPAPSPDAGEG